MTYLITPEVLQIRTLLQVAKFDFFVFLPEPLLADKNQIQNFVFAEPNQSSVGLYSSPLPNDLFIVSR